MMCEYKFALDTLFNGEGPQLPEFLALKQESRIVGHSSNPVCGFSVIEQVRLCAVWPTESWFGSCMNHTQGCMTV